MQDLSALTPPLLMCAVVIIAIVAFLRHEMGRSRADKSAPDEHEPVDGAQRGDDPDSPEHDDADDTRVSPPR